MKPSWRNAAKPHAFNANTMRYMGFVMMSSLATLSPAALLSLGGGLGFVLGFFVAGIVVSLRGKSANADLRAGLAADKPVHQSVFVPPRRCTPD